ncbi:hypothetical protein [Rhizobium sp. WSM1325]|uniref:hypothetical protein n=1 Tax=Rhizobium sp. WSM1325 TaxID=3444086 RepID=UPI000FED1CA7|nr:hypothetical protein [Rhizobium leguminosarum]RWY70040.1 hypothetical protein EHI48_27120 [Rhizobium leguminosarum]
MIRLASIVILALLSFSYPANAITIGLDRGTREMIEKLPSDIAKALLDTIVQAQPLIDKSVVLYLTTLDKIVADNIARGASAIQCGIVGTADLGATEFRASLASVLYLGGRDKLNQGKIGDYTQNFSDKIDEMRNRVTTSTKATDISIAYSDLLIRGAIVKCAVNISPALAQTELDAQIRRIQVPSLEWNILIGDRDKPYCQTIHDCVVKRRDEMSKYLHAADNRDKVVTYIDPNDRQPKTTSAQALFDTLEPTPALPGLLALGHIQVLDYEHILESLRQIERGVEAMRAKRLDQAADELTRSKAAGTEAIKNYTNNLNNVNGGGPVDRQMAIQRTAGMLKQTNDVVTLATAAKTDDAGLTADADALIASMNTNAQNINALKDRSQKDLDEMELRAQRDVQKLRMYDKAPK